MADPIFHELVNVRTKSELYHRWREYLLNISEDDVREIIENGLTYQADALRSMARELIAGQQVHKTLLRKIDAVYERAQAAASMLR